MIIEEIMAVDGYEVYKNPKSLKRMEGYLRGISYPNGDLFVVEQALHSRLMVWLNENGYEMPDIIRKASMVEGIKKGYIAWQRNSNKDEFCLGESIDFEYSGDYFDRDELVPYIEKYVKKIKQKNLKYDFILERINTND